MSFLQAVVWCWVYNAIFPRQVLLQTSLAECDSFPSQMVIRHKLKMLRSLCSFDGVLSPFVYLELIWNILQRISPSSYDIIVVV